MGMRFRKSVKICKGVKVNFSKSGASLSLGGRGHSMNFGHRGTRATVGIPGTGLSYSTKVGGSHKSRSSHRSTASRSPIKKQFCGSPWLCSAEDESRRSGGDTGWERQYYYRSVCIKKNKGHRFVQKDGSKS